MRRSPRLRYPYFPGDPDPFIRPLPGFGPAAGAPPPPPPPPPLAPPADPNAGIFAALERLTSLLASSSGGAADLPSPAAPARASLEGSAPTTPPGFDDGASEPLPSGLRLLSQRASAAPPITRAGGVDASTYFEWLSDTSPSDEQARSTDEPEVLYPGDPGLQGEWGINVGDGLLVPAQGRPSRQQPLLMSPTGRIINLPEWFRWNTWINNQQALRQLDPGNRMLQNLYSPGWTPSERDLRELRNEILIARSRLGAGEQFHGHHPLPNAQNLWFSEPARGILRSERDLGVMFIPPEEHVGRLGVHPWWEYEFREFRREHNEAKRDHIYEHLRGLLYQYGHLRER